MKTKLLLLTGLAFATALSLAFGFRSATTAPGQPQGIITEKKIIRCGPDWEQLNQLIEEAEIPPVEGAGTHRWKISTNSDSAQFYFNQGINMYYSFHIIEAMASFKKAERFDSAAAMLPWAQALAYGPNINDIGYAASPEALKATAKAVALSSAASKKEKMLIAAMQVRYSADSTQTRSHLNQLYVDKMKEAYDQFADDPDVAALYADAMMLQHPWDLWFINGNPKPWTPQIRTVLEKLLARAPNHPGANHYYIHVMEPSPYFSKALPSADRLGAITPGLSHTVHMPSHIYLRAGLYNKGVRVNENAIKSYKKLIPLYGAVTGNDFLYIIHNLHMQTNNAMHAGRAAYTIESAFETMNSVPSDYLAIPGAMGSYMQYIHMTPVIAMVRFGKWEELLNYPQPGAALVYANVIYRFGRGMALVARADLKGAEQELNQMQQLMKDSILYAPFLPFSPAIEGASVASHLLTGMIALKQKNNSAAIAAMQQAVTIEDNMVYNEPRDWMLNPRHYLGKALLVAGKWKEAEAVFKKDLEKNNENVWALKGLQQAYQLNMNKNAGLVLTRLNKAASKADIKISGPVL